MRLQRCQRTFYALGSVDSTRSTQTRTSANPLNVSVCMRLRATGLHRPLRTSSVFKLFRLTDHRFGLLFGSAKLHYITNVLANYSL